MRSGSTRCRIIIFLLLALAGFFAAWFLHRSYISPRDIRNVLLISIDTCRADHLSCYGYKYKTTPNIDALAAEGILLENVISPVPQTLPAHSSMLSGTIPPYHGVHDNFGYVFDESNISLAEILKGAGFTTGAAISAVVLDSQFGLDQGFDTYHDRFESPLEDEQVEQRQAGKTTAIALDWLEKNKDKRFFFFLHYFDPHDRYQSPEPFASQFAENPYAGEVAYTDYCIGQVIQKLKDLKLYSSTLLIITADHGEMLGEHGEPTHAYFIYQSAIKVPLIFKLPGRNKPARIKSIVGLIDILPTICGLLNIETPNTIQGIDLSPSFKGGAIPVQDRYLFCESLCATKYTANSLLGIVNDRFKYIQTTRPELYDLAEDSAESNNLVAEEQQQVRIMKHRLAEMLDQSVRKVPPGSSVAVDNQTIERLKSLGYVGEPVIEDLSFDRTKDDPKDLLEYHLLNGQIDYYFSVKKYDKVEMYAEQMIQKRPNCPIAFEKLGATALTQENYSNAIVYFQKVIALKPDNTRAYNDRGLAYLRKGDYDHAVGDFNKAIELDSKDALAYSNRGLAYTGKGDYERAIRDFDQVIQFDPSYAKTYNNRALAYWKKGDYHQATRDFEKFIKLDPTDAIAHKNISRLFVRQGQAQEAISHYREALRLRADWLEVMNDLAWILATHEDIQIRDGAAAVRLAERACQLTNYKHPAALDSLAAAYAEVGQFDTAVRTAEKAIWLALAAGKEKLAMDIQNRLESYKANRPYRESFT